MNPCFTLRVFLRFSFGRILAFLSDPPREARLDLQQAPRFALCLSLAGCLILQVFRRFVFMRIAAFVAWPGFGGLSGAAGIIFVMSERPLTLPSAESIMCIILGHTFVVKILYL